MKVTVNRISNLWLRSVIGIWFLFFLCLDTIAVEPAGWDFPQTGRIVAFGDVHGAYSELIDLLRQADVIDADTNWSGGTTQLVSLGDLFDRGPDSRQVVELLMRLQDQAPAQNGSVHVVLGNHEVMLATGDMRYVSADEYATYASEETAEEREALYQKFVETQDEEGNSSLRAAFDQRFPAGFIALSRSHGVEGKIGQWLLAQPLALKIGDNLFMHGGISPRLNNHSLDAINGEEKQAITEYIQLVTNLTEQGVLNPTIDYSSRELWLSQQLTKYKRDNGRRSTPEWADQSEQLTELQGGLVLSDSGPTWYRGTASCHPYVSSFDVDNLLSSWNAARVVIGHTPTATRRVVSRMNGTVILADTGMLSAYYKGRAAAVIIQNNEVSVMYAGEAELQAPIVERRSVPRQPTGFTDAELEQFLLTAEITGNELIGTGITKPHRLTLRQGDISFDAVYKDFDSDPGLASRRSYNRRTHNESDRYVYDIATYKLDRMLDLNMVPVSVERKVKGKKGVVTLWLENTINERDRLEEEDFFNGQCPQIHQYRLRIIFDVLIHNDDRNLTNILWTDDKYDLLFIDHSRAFRSHTKKPQQIRRQSMYLSKPFRDKLTALTEENLTAELGEYLHPRQISAMLARRDLILKEAK